MSDVEVREQRKAEEREEYRRVWREHPQTDEEFGWSDRVAAEATAEGPWESDLAPSGGHTSIK